MQIQSDYNTYSGLSYEQKHHHHITQCLHEDRQGHNKAATATADSRKDTLSSGKFQHDFKEESTDIHEKTDSQSVGKKKGKGFVKSFWNLLGEETVSPAVKQIFFSRIININKWENIREKIKARKGAILKSFGKEGRAFGALTDPKGYFRKKREADKHLEENKEKGTRQKEEAIPAAFSPESHLMDSYSRTGAYCRLNENLTYQKNSVSVRPEKRFLKDE